MTRNSGSETEWKPMEAKTSTMDWAKKSKYLKKPRTPKFKIREKVSKELRRAGRGLSANPWPRKKSIGADVSIRSRKRQSHHPQKKQPAISNLRIWARPPIR